MIRWILVTFLASCTTIPQAPRSPGAPPLTAPTSPLDEALRSDSGPVGIWSVVWDRSRTDWTPSLFHGTLVITENSVGLDWLEAAGTPQLWSLALERDRLQIVLTAGDNHRMVIKGEVEDGVYLLGHMKSENADGPGVPWTPLTGTRVPTLERVPMGDRVGAP